jgi:hypothetical protein
VPHHIRTTWLTQFHHAVHAALSTAIRARFPLWRALRVLQVPDSAKIVMFALHMGELGSAESQAHAHPDPNPVALIPKPNPHSHSVTLTGAGLGRVDDRGVQSERPLLTQSPEHQYQYITSTTPLAW